MKLIEEVTSGKSYRTQRFCYDKIGYSTADYDDDEDRIIQWQNHGENRRHDKYIPLKKLADQIKRDESIIAYFLDGSRHVFKVDDIAYSKKIYPVIAGQIGVGCCERKNKKMKKYYFEPEYVLVLPDMCYADGIAAEKKIFLASRCDKLNELPSLKRLDVKFSKIMTYSTSTSKVNKMENLGVEVVQDYMCECEKLMVEKLVKNNLLNQDHYLLKDGSLEYRDIDNDEIEARELNKIKYNYQWVIGVSKQFNPALCRDHKGKTNMNYIADLPLYHRTPVARYESGRQYGVVFGVWYIRLRDKSVTRTPFDGVVKVEKILMDDELDCGLDSDTVNLISASILNDRNPTCYGRDKRWANHLYPVYLTESFVKSKYISEETFLQLF